MHKVLRIGTINENGNGRRTSVYFKVEDKPYGLSFTGVIGPRRSGNAEGGCGQIVMEFAHRNPDNNDKRFSSFIRPEDVRFAPGWDGEKLYDFVDAWEKHHMKNVRADAKVRKFLESLPDANQTPAWV